MALDDFVIKQLGGIERSYKEMTERLGDPDLQADNKKLTQVSKERAKVSVHVCALLRSWTAAISITVCMKRV
jgi:protein subunit release factor A